jgi:hypothetical protein
MDKASSSSNTTTDGKESTNEIRGAQAKSALKWDGDVRHDFTIANKWALSDDGRSCRSAGI